MNEGTRALARAAWGHPFTDEERVVYGLLVVKWDAAVRSGIVEAA
ncbi:hypothetical protein ABZ027_42565 [Streptomyces sp. NPDC006332]